MMDFKTIVLNLMTWAIIAIIIGFAFEEVDINLNIDYGLGTFNIDSGFLIIIMLVIATTFSLDGFKFDKKALLNKKVAIDSIVLTFIVNVIVTLIMAVIFIPINNEVVNGFFMIAAMPCAVSVITAASLCGNNQETAIAATFYSYLAGLILTPLISWALLQSAVNPLQVFQYILLFIVSPIILAILIKPLHLKKWVKKILINISFGFMIFFSVNGRRDCMLDNIELSLLVLVIVVLRIAVLHIISIWYVRKRKIGSDSNMTFFVLGVWKTTGLSAAMSMSLLANMPLAVIPCIMSVIVEDIWFPWIVNRKDRIAKRMSAAEEA